MLTSTRTLTALGLVGLAVGIPVWLAIGNGMVGGAITVLGGVVLALAAVGRHQRANDPEARLRNERADQQRLHGETAAGAENLEDRPPATGG